MADAAFVTRLGAWLPGALLLFLVAGFVLPSEPAYSLVFYVAVIPCVAACIWDKPAAVAGRFSQSAVAGRFSQSMTGAPGGQAALTRPSLDLACLLAVGLIVWSGLTLLWGIDDGHRGFRFAGDSAATLVFVLAMIMAWSDAARRARVGSVLVVAGAANAAFSIAVFFITNPIYPRLRGWGATHHEILGAAVMTLPALTALSRALAPVAARRARVRNAAAFAVMLVFILMTESRGPLLAGGAGVLFLCTVSIWRVRAFLAMAALGAIWFALPKAARQHGEMVMVQRGSSHRFQVWNYTLGLIGDRPLFGHGLAANLRLVVGGPKGDLITFPHDLYLSLLFYSGVAGFALFVALAGVLTWRLVPPVWRKRAGQGAWRECEWAWLAALWIDVLVVGLTDLGQITKGPGPLWLIVWVPVGLLLGATRAGGDAGRWRHGRAGGYGNEPRGQGAAGMTSDASAAGSAKVWI